MTLRTLYRIVPTATPARDDFLSDQALGHPPRPDHPELWDGISTWSSFRQAQRKAQDLPFLGTHVAELRLDLGQVIIRRTLRSSRGHHTVWSDPDYLLTCVIDVRPV